MGDPGSTQGGTRPDATWAPPPPHAGWQGPGGGMGAAPWEPPAKRESRTRLIAAVVIGVIVVVALLAGALVLAFRPFTDQVAPGFDVAREVAEGSGGRVESANYRITNGVAFLTVTLDPGLGEQDARDIACRLVQPALARHGLATTDFGVFAADGRPLATPSTPCP